MHRPLPYAAPTGILDRYAIVPLLACVYATIVFPLIIVTCSPDDTVCLLAARPENKIVWPILATIAAVIAVRNLSRLTLPPNITFLVAYLALAGASVLWAFKPEIAFVRFSQQVMIVFSIVVPVMLTARTTDMLRGLFICFAVAAALNVAFVLGRPPITLKFATWGYPGYFSGKNYLGEFAAITLLLSMHEMLHSGLRRTLGIVFAVVAVALLVASNSKTSMGLALLAPLLAGATLVVRRMTRLSPALILISIPISYAILSGLTGFTINRLSYMLYGDPTFTGRTIIWDFARSEIARSPLLGWGYQSFWLVGPDAPSILRAPGWVKHMPNAHNGYLDTMLETGYAGFALLLAFILATLHAIGCIADRTPARAWMVLSLVLFVIVANGLESGWVRGFEMLWVVFLVVAADIARDWRDSLRRRVAPSIRSAAPRWLGTHRPRSPTTAMNAGRPVAAG